MKFIYFVLFSVISSPLWATPEAAPQATPQVQVTIRPLWFLTGIVMQGVAEPQLLLKNNASPHTYSLKPSDIQAVREADLLIAVHPRLENFLPQLAKVLKSEQIWLAATSPGLQWLTLDDHHHHDHADKHGHEGHEHEGHEHEGHEHEGHEHEGHEHEGHEHEGHEKAKENLDYHLWLAPENAQAMVLALAAKLSAQDPSHAEQYQANAQAFVADLAARKAGWQEKLLPVQDKKFLVMHQAYQYFEHSFGLTGNAGALLFNPQLPPSGRHLQELRQRLQADNIACVFREPQFSDRPLQALVRGSDTSIGVLDPLSSHPKADGNAYFALLDNLTNAFVDCLKP